MTDPLQPSRRTTAFRGAVFTVAMRWTDRLLGLVSTLVLARLLVPADFGLVAMAMVVVGLLDVLLDLGVSTALIRGDRIDEDDFHTAWTLRLAQSALAAAVLLAGAPAVALYYGDDRVIDILRVIALTVFIGGFENIGIVSFQRNMEFGRDFQFFFLKKVVGMAFAIAAAIVLRSYWALVLGNLVSRSAGVLISYWLSAFRPRVSLARFSSIWAFSQWNLLIGVGRYVNGAVGRFVIGGRGTAADLGAYTVGEEVASMPVSELLAPLGRVMLPVFAAAKGDAGELLRVATLAQSVQALIAMPASVGVALVARDAVPLLLGEHWLAAVPVVQIIALAGIATSLGHSLGYLLTVLGNLKTVCALTWAKVVVLVGLLYFVVPPGSVTGVAWAFLATTLCGLAAMQWVVGRILPGMGGSSILRQMWRPLLASAAMALIVLAVGREMTGFGPFGRLVAQIVAGVVTYAACVAMLWRAVRSPVGPESYILEKIRRPRS